MARKKIKTSAKTVASASEAEPLFEEPTLTRNAIVQAKLGNSGTVGIRDSVEGTDGFTMGAGDVFLVEMEDDEEPFDLSQIWLDVSVAAEGVDYLYTPV